MSIDELLQQAKKHGVTPADLAVATGSTPERVLEVMTGRVYPADGEVGRLAAALKRFTSPQPQPQPQATPPSQPQPSTKQPSSQMEIPPAPDMGPVWKLAPLEARALLVALELGQGHLNVGQVRSRLRIAKATAVAVVNGLIAKGFARRYGRGRRAVAILTPPWRSNQSLWGEVHKELVAALVAQRPTDWTQRREPTEPKEPCKCVQDEGGR